MVKMGFFEWMKTLFTSKVSYQPDRRRRREEDEEEEEIEELIAIDII
jgi:hypothetical protein